MRCIYRFGMYAIHALYIRPPYAIESRWPPRVRGMYAVHTPLALWIRNGQVFISDIIRSGIAIHTPYAPHVRHPCAIDTQLIRNTCEIVALEMFHLTISAILLRICSFSRTPYERHGIAGQWNRASSVNALRPRQNGGHFSDDTFKWIFFNENVWIWIKFQKFVAWGPISNILYWFRYWLGADQAASHYLDQWWLVYWSIYASLGLNELSI